MKQKALYKSRTNLQTWLIATIVAVLGLAMLYCSENLINNINWLQSIVRDLGSLLVASVAISILWDLFSKRAILDELLSATRLVEDIQETGLIGLSSEWSGKIDWSDLFKNSRSLSIILMYGRTWRNNHNDNLKKFFKRQGNKITVVLPDPEDEVIMEVLSRRINVTPDELKRRIQETVNDFILLNTSQNLESELVIWYVPIVPVFSYYCFDNAAVFTLYKHSIEKVEVPTFLVQNEGSIYKFLRNDFEKITNPQITQVRKVYPVNL